MSSTARFFSNPDGTFEIRSDFNKQFVEGLKEIPPEDRDWGPGEKVWSISNPDWYPTLVSLAEECYDNVYEE